jgi:hypothetical protein
MKKLILSALITSMLFLFNTGLEAGCPEGNKITKMTSGMASYKAVLPLDYSKIVSAAAYTNKAGTKLQVCLSNGDFTPQKMASSFVVPIKKKNEFIAVLNFSNGQKPIVAGKYSPTAGYGKPFRVTAEVKVQKGEKGTIVSLGVMEGTAEILEMKGDTMCGTFDLKNKKGDSHIAGHFNVKITKSRW